MAKKKPAKKWQSKRAPRVVAARRPGAKKRATKTNNVKEPTRSPVPSDQDDSPDAGQTPAEPLAPPPGGLTIRMYRQGLGDCFLLGFGTDHRPRYMLIDCGVLRGQEHGAERLRLVMKDIAAVTDNRLDVVVVSHEHSDHLSGFVDGKGIFQAPPGRAPKVQELWMGWTEDPDDDQVSTVKSLKGKAVAALGGLLALLEKLSPVHFAALAIRGILETTASFGDFPGGAVANASVTGATVDASEAAGMMAKVRDALGKTPRYLRPGERIQFPDEKLATHRIYVLGPPRDRDFLRGEGKKSRQDAVYLSESADSMAFLAALEHYLHSEQNRPPDGEGLAQPPAVAQQRRQTDVMEELKRPFEERLRRKLVPSPQESPAWRWGDEPDADYIPKETKTYFAEHYGLAHGEEPAKDEYPWRRIDFDWLLGSQLLGLKLGGDTNNTSLVLAIEVGPPGEGPVVLFAADAQVGNWWSWRDLEWTVGNKRITAADLLRRTVVYKVGHHASHNGTAKQDADGKPWGLELMSSDLIAMIPVDEATAHKTGARDKKWDMPNPDLYDRLRQRTEGRVLRSDEKQDGRVQVGESWSTVPGVPQVRWRRGPRGSKAALYYDLELKGNG